MGNRRAAEDRDPSVKPFLPSPNHTQRPILTFHRTYSHLLARPLNTITATERGFLVCFFFFGGFPPASPPNGSWTPMVSTATVRVDSPLDSLPYESGRPAQRSTVCPSSVFPDRLPIMGLETLPYGIT